MPSIDIVIVNWNAGDQLRECLESIRDANSSATLVRQVIVVDNASRDGSIDGIEGTAFGSLKVIRNRTNVGFGAACNQGAASGDSALILYLNPDVRLFKSTLTDLVAFWTSPASDGVGICGVKLVDESGRSAVSCSRFPTAANLLAQTVGLDKFAPSRFTSQAMTDWDHASSRYVDQVMGAFFCIRRRLFEELGGFDERFFVYFEEVDLAYRAQRLGWRSYYLNEATAFHRGQGTTDNVKAIRLFYSLRSRILYAFKHFPMPSAMLVAIGTLLIEPVSRLALALGRRSRNEFTETLDGYRRLWTDLPRMTLKRG